MNPPTRIFLIAMFSVASLAAEPVKVVFWNLEWFPGGHGFQSCWQGKPLAQRLTLPSTPSENPKYPPFPDACFDHVFAKGAKIVSSAVFTPESEPSDHRPVVVEVALAGTTP